MVYHKVVSRQFIERLNIKLESVYQDPDIRAGQIYAPTRAKDYIEEEGRKMREK